MSVACVVIASAKRRALLDTEVMPSVLVAGFDEVVVVGEYHAGEGYRYLEVPPLTQSTTDALVKRDVGTLATTSDWLFYVCDDHAVRKLGTVPTDPTMIGVPARYCHVENMTVLLNMGLDERDPDSPYCGGHAGLYSRPLIQSHPWSTMPHDRLWDLYASRIFVRAGATLKSLPDWEIEDLEPEAHPWR